VTVSADGKPRIYGAFPRSRDYREQHSTTPPTDPTAATHRSRSVEREDLGAQFARVRRRLVEAELPLLAAHGLSMWGYIALSQLARQPAGTQLQLARAIGYDKTRLVALLDDLEAAGLLTREADPIDRRARIVRLTAAGRQRHATAQASIHAMEDDLLQDLKPNERKGLLVALARLTQDSRRASN